MNCTGCGLAMETAGNLNYFHCTQCGLDFPNDADDGVAIVGEAVGVNCPLCRLPLVSALIEEETVFHCSQCRGFLTLTDTFSFIVAKRRAHHGPNEKRTGPFDPSALERLLACPKCHQPMDTHPYFGGGNVVVDTCEGCGLIWLDAGELASIERYIPYVHQIERTLTLRGGRYQGGPSDLPLLGYVLDSYWRPGRRLPKNGITWS
jgi:Zn-finger nucleic acid-binding protein